MKIDSPGFGVWDAADELRPHTVRGAMPDTEAQVVAALDAKYAHCDAVDEARAERIWLRIVGAVVDAPLAPVVVHEQPRVILRNPPERRSVEVGEVRVIGTTRAVVVRVTLRALRGGGSVQSWVWWRGVDFDASGKMHVGAWRRLLLDAAAAR